MLHHLTTACHTHVGINQSNQRYKAHEALIRHPYDVFVATVYIELPSMLHSVIPVIP